MEVRPINQNNINKFLEAAQSLKLYRRAELTEDNGDRPLIEQLYVDPLPGEQVFQVTMKPNTTFLIGRKGTGKSTIIQRCQHEIRKSKHITSAYLDVKTIYESSQVDPALVQKVQKSDCVLPEGEIKRILLYKSFINATIKEIRSELERQMKRTFMDKAKSALFNSTKEVFEGLDEIINASSEVQFENIIGMQAKQINKQNEVTEFTAAKMNAEGQVSPTEISAKASAGVDTSETERAGQSESYSEIMMRVFNIKSVIEEVSDLLRQVDVRHLYIFLDDFSELPEDAMRVFVDAILSPLNNWSNEFIKFKVAAYPGRVYLGAIDKTKIDEVHLDTYELYGSSDVGNMEMKAIDFTRRLVESRIRYFSGRAASEYFSSDPDSVWRILFFATMANPRNIGHILYYLHEAQVAYGRTFGVRAIREAAQKYYEQKISSYFQISKFLHEDFNERSSIYSLKELLESIVARARTLKSYRRSAVMRDIEGQPPTSHFFIVPELEHLLSTLELNFFLTKYFSMSDRDGKIVSVFCLNFGLCEKYAIEFGRPAGRREYRLYFVERVFDYTQILKRYLSNNQEISCDQCGATFGVEKLEALRMYDMMCPRCKNGHCHVTNLSKKYETLLQSIQPELLLPATELGILQTLHAEKKPLYAGDIAADLDCSYQLVGKRGKMMEDRGLVNRNKKAGGRRTYHLTSEAEEAYFSDVSGVELNLPDDDTGE